MNAGFSRMRSLLYSANIVLRAAGIFLALIAPTLANEGFVDRTAVLGLQLSNSAACWVDVDNDGWTDLCAGGVVWKNEQGKAFVQLATGVGEVVAADFDNDGFADLFSWSQVRVYRNQEGKSFVPIEMPELPRCSSRGACWGDFNGDGFADIYVGGYEDWNAGITFPDMLLLGHEGKSFQLAWSEARYRTRGVTACDFDRDGDLDVYTSNYRLQPNVLWQNDGKGQGKDVAESYNALATSPGFAGGHSIGAAWADFDGDGEFDLFAGNFAHVDGRGDQPKSRFLRNLGPDHGYKFDDRGPCGVFYQESYATPAAGDYNLDGRVDLFFTTVYGTASFGRPNHPVLFRNEGNWTFADVSQAAGAGGLPPTYQAAWADFDRDGDLDLVTAGRLFENRVGRAGHWLELRLHGDGVAVNRSAIGAQARVAVEGSVFTRQVEAGTGEGNQNDLTMHFGLGDQTEPVRLEVRWPDGSQQVVDQVGIDQLVTIRFGE